MARLCIADKNCPMTAGYYVGGGQYICWLHALTVKGMIQAIGDQEIGALPERESVAHPGDPAGGE